MSFFSRTKKAPPPLIDELEREFETESSAAVADETRLATLMERRRNLLLQNGDGVEKELDVVDAEIASVTRSRDRHAARVDVLTVELGAAREREAAAKARRNYDEAVARNERARRWLHERYPVLAAELADGFKLLASADAEADRINDTLPPGCEPLDLPSWSRVGSTSGSRGARVYSLTSQRLQAADPDAPALWDGARAMPNFASVLNAAAPRHL